MKPVRYVFVPGILLEDIIASKKNVHVQRETLIALKIYI